MKTDKELQQIAEEWLEATVDAWFWDYGSWDDLIMDGVITEEELEQIQSKVRFTHKSYIK